MSEEQTEKQEQDERRLALLHIDPDRLVDWINKGSRVVPGQIPAGAVVVNSAWKSETNTFVITLRHESFERVQVGWNIPSSGPLRFERW